MTGSVSQACLCFGLTVRPQGGNAPFKAACVAQPPASPSGLTPGNQGPLLLPPCKLMTSLKTTQSIWQKLVLILGGELM